MGTTLSSRYHQTSRGNSSNVENVSSTQGSSCHGGGAPAVTAQDHLDDSKRVSPHTASALSLHKLENLLSLPLADRRMRGRQKSHGLLRRASEKAFLDLVNEKQFQRTGDIPLSSCHFPFENAVFEGGGVKGIAYVGAIKCLEEAGIKLKRFGGSSIGATVAGLLAVGYTADELSLLYQQEMSMFIRDSRCELLCFLPRLIRNFGMNPGKRFLRWYGKCLEVKTADADITFLQVYERFGTELCVVVLNMNTGREEYFHPKTTPMFSVKVAVRMAISLPGLLQPVEREWQSGHSDMYIDGGLICNYPIHIFDGWWLSMRSEDRLFSRIASDQNLNLFMERSSQFKGRNPATIGFKFTNNAHFFNDTLIPSTSDETNRPPLKHIIRPDTRLSRKKLGEALSQEFYSAEQSRRLDGLLQFFEALRSCSNEDGLILKSALEHNIESMYSIPSARSTSTNGSKLPDFSTLIGKMSTLLEAIREIPADENGYITHADLDINLIKHGIDILRVLESSLAQRKTFKGVGSFAQNLQLNLMCAARRSYIKQEDRERTVDINSDYIHFSDFSMSTADKEFLMQQGYKSTRAFLQHWAYRDLNQRHVTSTTEGVGELDMVQPQHQRSEDLGN